MDQTRIDRRFASLRAQNRPGLVTFLTAGDPDYATSLEIIKALPAAGADVIEIGMPFSDPMAEGPPIQAASKRALKAGQTLQRTLDMVGAFRLGDDSTPIVLMGYYNPIHSFGRERFLEAGSAAGVDGLIIVDLPPEEDDELCIPAMRKNINFIRLATPTTDAVRLPKVLNNASGFIYYVSITGITGTAAPDTSQVAKAVDRIRSQCDLPVAVGFGVKTAEQARAIGRNADAVVVGSALVNALSDSLIDGAPGPATISGVIGLVGELAAGVRAARPVSD